MATRPLNRAPTSRLPADEWAERRSPPAPAGTFQVRSGSIGANLGPPDRPRRAPGFFRELRTYGNFGNSGIPRFRKFRATPMPPQFWILRGQEEITRFPKFRISGGPRLCFGRENRPPALGPRHVGSSRRMGLTRVAENPGRGRPISGQFRSPGLPPAGAPCTRKDALRISRSPKLWIFRIPVIPRPLVSAPKIGPPQ